MKANQIIGINVRWRSPNESEFNKDAQHIYVDIFTSFAERLRSLSCLVYSLSMLFFSCFFDFNYLFNISLRALIEMYSG